MLAACCLLAGIPFSVGAQDIEPRAYSNAPVGVNFLIAGNGYTRGGLSFDSSVPITDAHLDTSKAVLAYARVLDLGQLGKVRRDRAVTWLSGTAHFQGAVERDRGGFGDPRSGCRSTSTARRR